MVSLDESSKILSDFGLTPSQARVYAAIVQVGITPIGKVSQLSKVRREEVYRLLPKLEEKGLIERILGNPVKVKATPVDEALSNLIREEQERTNNRLSELNAKKEQFLTYSRSNNVTPEPEAISFSLITEGSGRFLKSSDMIKEAKRKIDIVMSRHYIPQFVASHTDELREATTKGILIRIITHEPEGEDLIPMVLERYLPKRESVSLRYAHQLPNRYIIVDDREALVSTSTEASLTRGPILWSNSGSLIAFMAEDFQNLWNISINWTALKDETNSEKKLRFVDQLASAGHVVFIYDSLESKHDVLLHYIKDGLSDGDAAIYVCSEEDTRQIGEAMKQFDIDVEKYKKTGALKVMSCTDFYMINKKFSIERTIGLWTKNYNEALSKGFKGLKIVEETNCFFQQKLAKELIAYEKALRRVLDIPINGICAYNINELTGVEDAIDIYNELIKIHGTVLFIGMDDKLGKFEIGRA